MNASAAITDIRRDLVALLPRLRRFALTLTGNASDADRLVGEVCAQAIQKSHLWKGEGRLESWIFNLVRIAAGGEPTRHSHHEAQTGPHAVVGSDDRPLPEPLPQLSRSEASALLLVDVEAFDYAEAASILGITCEALEAGLCAARLSLSATPPGMAERRA